METLAVIAPLDIPPDDRAWIEDLRRRHDPQHDLVEAHFTLVFPLAAINETGLARHVGEIAGRTSAITFRLNNVRAVKDSLAPRCHVFLLPDEGEPEIRRLHAALYGGDLAPHLRTDIPYEPHVTVAAFETLPAAEILAREIGEFQIEGRLRTLALMSVEDDAIRQRQSFQLR